MADERRDLAKFDRELMPPLSIPQPEASAEVAPEPADAPPPPFSARGRVRWTPRRVRRMVPSKLKEVVVAILTAMELPPRRGQARRRRATGPQRRSVLPGTPPADDYDYGGGTREGAD